MSRLVVKIAWLNSHQARLGRIDLSPYARRRPQHVRHSDNTNQLLRQISDKPYISHGVISRINIVNSRSSLTMSDTRYLLFYTFLSLVILLWSECENFANGDIFDIVVSIYSKTFFDIKSRLYWFAKVCNISSVPKCIGDEACLSKHNMLGMFRVVYMKLFFFCQRHHINLLGCRTTASDLFK